jgi:hypothetical protein
MISGSGLGYVINRANSAAAIRCTRWPCWRRSSPPRTRQFKSWPATPPAAGAARVARDPEPERSARRPPRWGGRASWRSPRSRATGVCPADGPCAIVRSLRTFVAISWRSARWARGGASPGWSSSWPSVTRAAAGGSGTRPVSCAAGGEALQGLGCLRPRQARFRFPSGRAGAGGLRRAPFTVDGQISRGASPDPLVATPPLVRVSQVSTPTGRSTWSPASRSAQRAPRPPPGGTPRTPERDFRAGAVPAAPPGEPATPATFTTLRSSPATCPGELHTNVTSKGAPLIVPKTR